MTAPGLQNRIRAYIRKTGMLQAGDRVLLCVSGGADSVFLFYFMKEFAAEWNLQLRAVHVHHGIRGTEADGDELFVRQICEEEEVPLDVYHVDAPAEAKKRGMSLEETARILRYECIRKSAERWGDEPVKEDCRIFGTASDKAAADAESKEHVLTQPAGFQLNMPDNQKTGFSEKNEWKNDQSHSIKAALAHHMDDQAETVLFRILRGTGIRGLKAMEPVREEEGMTLIRPLLCIRRDEIRGDLAKRGISWREDSTNNENDATRNIIRNEVMPLLEKEVNMRSVEHLAQLAERAAEVDELIRVEADAAEHRKAGPEKNISTILLKEDFRNLPSVIQKELVRRAIAELSGRSRDIGQKHLEEVLNLFSAEEGKRTDLPYGLAAVRVRDGVNILYARKLKAGSSEGGRQKSGISGNRGETDVYTNLPEHDREPDERADVPGEAGNADYIEREIRLQLTDSVPSPIPQIKYTKWLDYDKISNTPVIRTRQRGDYFTIDAEGHKKTLSDYFTDEKVPKNLRDKVILLADGSEIIWAVGFRIGYRYRVTESTEHVLLAEAVKTGDEVVKMTGRAKVSEGFTENIGKYLKVSQRTSENI